MAKVFTIDFPYKTNTYSALITIKTKGDEQVAYVHLFDERLNALLNGEELEFNLANGIRRHANKYNPEISELIVPIKEAALQHLKMVQ